MFLDNFGATNLGLHKGAISVDLFNRTPGIFSLAPPFL